MAGQGGAIKAGAAFVELFVEDNKLYRGLDMVAGKFHGWGQQMRSMGAQLGAGGGAVFGPMVAGLTEVTNRAAGMQLLADRMGEPIAAISTLAGGFERAGVSADQFGGIMEGLRTKVAEAANANGYLLDSMKSLGPAANMVGLSSRDMLTKFADGMKRIPDAANQLILARELGLQSILPQLKRGKEGIDELIASGGPSAIGTEEGRQAVAVTRAATAAWVDFKDTMRQVFVSLLPTAAGIADMSGQFKAGLATVREWVKENRAVVVGVAAVGAGLVTAGALVVGLGATAAAAGSLITLTVAGVKLAFGALLSPIGLATVAAGGLLYLLFTQTERGREGLAYLADGFKALAGRVSESLSGISDAIGAGDWSLAWKIGLAALKAEWLNFTFYVQVGWNLFKDAFVDGWKDAITGIKVLFVEMSTFVGRTLAATVRVMIEQLAKAAIVAGPAGLLLARRIREAAGGISSDASIQGEGDAARGRILADRERERREARQHRDDAAGAALQAREEARAELAGLNELARWRAEFARMPWLGEDEEEGSSPAANFSGPARLADVVKGTFSGSAINQQFGFGDTIPQQQLDAMRGTMANTSQIPQMAKDMNTLARGGRLGQ